MQLVVPRIKKDSIFYYLFYYLQLSNKHMIIALSLNLHFVVCFTLTMLINSDATHIHLQDIS